MAVADVMTLKLSDEQVAEIRRLGSSMTQRELAGRFGTSRPNISLILNGHTHAGPRTRNREPQGRIDENGRDS